MIFKLDLSIRLGTSNRSSFDSLEFFLDLDTISLNIADSLHTKKSLSHIPIFSAIDYAKKLNASN